MAKIHTTELSGAALDWAVQEALLKTLPQPERGLLIHHIGYGHPVPSYSTVWAQGGPIIEREILSIAYEPSLIYGDEHRWKAFDPMSDAEPVHGPTPLIAAMRCYVASKLGDELDVPAELYE